MDSTLLPILLGTGAFGGLLFGMRNEGIQLPRYDAERRALEVGFIGDVMFGVGGAMVVFLMIPADFSIDGDVEKALKLSALALVGGYGGPALLDRVLNQTLRDLQAETHAVREDLSRQTEILETEVIERRRRDLEALSIVDAYLNDTENERIDASAVVDAVRMASDEARMNIYERARNVRRLSWRDDPAATERTIPVFQALLEVGAGEEEHRIKANLAYAMKDKKVPDYRTALQLLDDAIELRQAAGLMPSAWYHFNRAVCAVELARRGESPVEAGPRTVLRDVEIARTNAVIERAVAQSQTLQEWLRSHERAAALETG